MDDATQKLVDEARLTLPGDARMEAYYFGFERTGVAAVDAILSAVAVAGKGSHHTEGWSCESEYGYYSDRAGLPANPGGSAVSLIQAAASEAAGLVRSLADALEAAQRPPVSPEQREALDELIADVLIAERDEWPRDPGDAPSEVLAGAVTDAILARFSLPVLDVEKVARFLYSLDPAIQGWNGDPYAYNEPNAKRHRDRAQQWAERLIEALPTLTANLDEKEGNRDRA